MTLKRLSEPPQIGTGDILVVACFRNEMLRLPWFLTYYRKLGVDRFLLIDNASTDGAGDYLLGQSDVTLFHTTQSYGESRCGVDWQNEVLAEYAGGHWVFIVDIDELFIFPGCEETGLRAFLDYALGTGGNAVLAPMLDMYSDRSIAATGYRAGQEMLACCPYFDSGGYELGSPAMVAAGLPIRGGPRRRLFWPEGTWDFPSPVLHKIPLVLWQPQLRLTASTHDLEGVKMAAVTGMLLHFKLMQDFAESARREVERKEHFAGARQYRAYDAGVSSNVQITAFFDGSVRFRDSAQLCKLGLMKVPPDYPFLKTD